MDIAGYLSELLGQIGEVNVPGLGYFVQLRVDGYYNEADSTFYPPSHKLHFDRQYIDDDILAQYIAEKKKISLASSKYFTEKYITGLRQEAMAKEVPLADLGFLYFDEARIAFKPVEALANDPAFYGYGPIRLQKLSGTSFLEQLESVAPKPKPAPAIAAPPIATADSDIQPEPFAPPQEEKPRPELYTPAPVAVPAPDTEEDQEEFVFRGRTYAGEDDEEEGRKSRAWIWITILAIILLLAGGVFALYKYKPALFDRLKGMQFAPLKLKTPLKHDTIKSLTPIAKPDTGKDTTKKVSAVNKDTVAKNVTTAPAKAPVTTPAKTPVTVVNKTPAKPDQLAPIVDSTKVRYEIIGVRFNRHDMAGAIRSVKNFKSLGITNAHILHEPGIGQLIKVSLGTYSTKEDANDEIERLLKTGDVRPDIGYITINPRK